jgi:hypothetical protein
MEASRQLGCVEEEASAAVLTSETVTEIPAILQPLFEEKTTEATGHAATATRAIQNATFLALGKVESMSDATAQHRPLTSGAIRETHHCPNLEGVRNRLAGMAQPFAVSQLVGGVEEITIEVEVEVCS